jgi:hypothetical protein
MPNFSKSGILVWNVLEQIIMWWDMDQFGLLWCLPQSSKQNPNPHIQFFFESDSKILNVDKWPNI